MALWTLQTLWNLWNCDELCNTCENTSENTRESAEFGAPGGLGWATLDVVRLQLGDTHCAFSSAHCSYGGHGFQFGELHQQLVRQWARICTPTG